MRYCYYDLGQQQEDRCAVLRMRGSAANVILIDPLNFDRYRSGKFFFYLGGYCLRSPIRLQITEGEHWHLVIDHGDYKGRGAQPEMVTAKESRTEHEPAESTA
jgi:Domain of unknown function (DUF1883)